MTLVLGFDGGGSTARMAIAEDDGQPVFRAEAGGVNPQDNPAWQAAYDQLFAAAGALAGQVSAACLGLPGWGEAAALDAQVADYLRARLSCPLELMNDVELAHCGAFGGGAGVLLLSGTGSMAVGRAATGGWLRAGGFGAEIGDEGSAHAIGRAALARLSREIDGRSPGTDFGRALLAHLGGAGDPLQRLMGWLAAAAHPRSAIAGLARKVDALAGAGDPVAGALLAAAGAALAEHHAALAARTGPCAWSHAGSTFRSAAFADAVAAAVGTPPQPPVRDALSAALLRAAAAAARPAMRRGA
ncbi:N-acetylglucosamine kinase [Poseidonocella sp. HB161398]|uniref:N-acetylglucosamine kinase n=1 Tax=Poseidonocella sp. HB161398 TaxID=2320855 RepID=UPI001486046E|nr:BadF/BadG/BcrA/BcrD ATPase family protein [Poseidonocella sp. HB161398]